MIVSIDCSDVEENAIEMLIDYQLLLYYYMDIDTDAHYIDVPEKFTCYPE
jgi:hypothetical protein